tara:strand:- start:634 stop:840 length:207 start_codon:yes stop_codon:yes gene_type:complete
MGCGIVLQRPNNPLQRPNNTLQRPNNTLQRPNNPLQRPNNTLLFRKTKKNKKIWQFHQIRYRRLPDLP